MDDDEDWLWRPVMRGVLKAESLLDPNIRLEFIAQVNDALDVQDENDWRLSETDRDA
jgi:uncharacterized protein DUF6889